MGILVDIGMTLQPYILQTVISYTPTGTRHPEYYKSLERSLSCRRSVRRSGGDRRKTSQTSNMPYRVGYKTSGRSRVLLGF